MGTFDWILLVVSSGCTARVSHTFSSQYSVVKPTFLHYCLPIMSPIPFIFYPPPPPPIHLINYYHYHHLKKDYHYDDER